MSLSLDLGTKPAGLEVNTFGLGEIGSTIYLGNYEISLKDFLVTAFYVLTNTDLETNDPRLQFVKCVQSMKEVEGYYPIRKRLQAGVPPLPPLPLSNPQ